MTLGGSSKARQLNDGTSTLLGGDLLDGDSPRDVGTGSVARPTDTKREARRRGRSTAKPAPAVQVRRFGTLTTERSEDSFTDTDPRTAEQVVRRAGSAAAYFAALRQLPPSNRGNGRHPLLPVADAFVHNFIAAALDVYDGRRAARSLQVHCLRPVLANLERKAKLTARLRRGSAPTITPANISRVHLQHPLPHVCEAQFTVNYAGRLRAGFLRLEGNSQRRWIVTVFEVI